MRIYDDLEVVSPESNIARERFTELLIAVGQPEKAERLIRRALEIAKAHETTIHTISLEEKLAYCLCSQGKVSQGVEVARGALSHMLQLPAADEEDIAWCRHNLAGCLRIAGELVEAARELETRKKPCDEFTARCLRSTRP